MATLRPISCEAFVGVETPNNLGPASQLQWIAIDNLVVDESYQRSIDSKTSRNNVRIIASNFDWRRFTPVIVSPVAGGRFAIVDGQHRTTAALIVGVDQVPCCVILADQAEQARAFAAINGQITAIRPAHIFKAKLAHADPGALRVEAVCKAAGIKLIYNNRSASEMLGNETKALTAITRAIESHGDRTVRIALEIIRYNSGGVGGYLRPLTITALVEVLADHHEWRDHPQLQSAVNDLDLEEACRSAVKDAVSRKGVHARDLLQAMLITHLDTQMRVAA